MPRQKSLQKFFYKDKDGNVQKKETSIEKAVKSMLTEMGITFVQEYVVQVKKTNGKMITRVYDFYLKKEEVLEDGTVEKYDVLIEVHSYWHYPEGRVKNYHIIEEALRKKKGIKKKPRKKKPPKPTQTQRRNVINDKKKEAIARRLGIPLLIVWDHELKLFHTKVRRRIKEEVNRQIQKHNE